MLKIDTFILGQLQTNCYILSSQLNSCYIIDPADDFVFISDFIQNNSLTPKGIILTHGHFDHSLAAFFLKKIYNIPILASSKDLFLLKQIGKSSKFWTKSDYPSFSVVKIDFDLDKTSTFKFDKYPIKIIKTPGHTPGSISIYLKDINSLISGDLIFQNAIGRTDLSYSSRTDLSSSLKKILKLPPQTVIFPGHGPQTTILFEKDNLRNFL